MAVPDESMDELQFKKLAQHHVQCGSILERPNNVVLCKLCKLEMTYSSANATHEHLKLKLPKVLCLRCQPQQASTSLLTFNPKPSMIRIINILNIFLLVAVSKNLIFNCFLISNYCRTVVKTILHHVSYSVVSFFPHTGCALYFTQWVVLFPQP